MLPKPTVKQDWRWKWLEEQALVGQRGHGKPPPLYSSVADLKAVLDDYLVRNKDNKPEILPADDPGLLIFGFLGYYNDTNGKEVAEFFRIGFEDVKREGVEIEDVRKEYCSPRQIPMTPSEEATKLIREARHLIAHPLKCNGPLCSMSKCDCTDYAVSDLLAKACQVLGSPDRGNKVCQECGKEIQIEGSPCCSYGYNLCWSCCGRRK